MKLEGFSLGCFIQLPVDAYRPVIRANSQENGGSKLFISKHEMFSDEEAIEISLNLSSSSSVIVPGVDPIVGI